MEFDKVEQVGKVLVKQIKSCITDKPVYSDGPVEKELYEGFKSEPNYDAVISKRGNYSSWAQEYHLSPVRHNLLKWFPFDAEGSVLEVGAGCGALTGLLCSKLKKVTALEYSYQRARVIAQRHSSCSNLEVIVGGLQDYEEERLFDYITVIGVLEYAAGFYGGEKPFESFLKKVHTMLKPEGALILAIENKIGLKYIAGAPEEHTGRIFESIYSYPSSKIRTFSKQELAGLLEAAGFVSVQWYYPLPDYKRPKIVLSEEVTPGGTDSIWTLYPARTSGFGGKAALAERWFGMTLAQAGLFGEFANSFLVVARKTKTPEKLRCIRFWAANQGRKPEFRTSVRICVDDGKKYVVRSADNDRAIQFIGEIAQRELLAENFFKGKAEVVTGQPDDSGLRYRFIEFPSLEELIVDAIEKEDAGFEKSLVEGYIRFLETLPVKECIPERFIREFGLPSGEIAQPVKCLACAVFDCVPRNIKVGPQNWYIIDNEWTFDYPLPIDYLAFRGILTLIANLQSYIKTHASKDQPVVLLRGYGKNREYIPLSWLEILRGLKIPVNKFTRWETQFQNQVNIYQRNFRLRLSKNPKVLTHVELCKVPTIWDPLHRLNRLLSNIARVLPRRFR
jgi:2-polyprenyl-3-methyl-5-hydroxy-6-metoxy-1,4-benzoquinol methylase